jgi:hypothetical protein
MAGSTSCVEVVGHLLREEEMREVFEEFYKRFLATLEHYEMMADRREKRLRPLKPSKN